MRDIDGVIADFFSECRRVWGEPQIPGAYSLEEAYPMVSDSEIYRLVNLPATYTHLRPIQNARIADKILRDAGWEIVNVTCRPEEVQQETFEWLWDYGLASEDDVIPVLFVSHGEKIKLAHDGKFTAIIEDNHEIARSISRFHSRVYLFDYPFNQGPCGTARRIREPYWESVLTELLKE